MEKQITTENYIRLSDFGAIANGIENCFEALKKCFTKAAEKSGTIIVIEPGEYLIDSEESIPLYSDLTVVAKGAVFKFPKDLGICKYRTLFCGEDIKNFSWQGGHFEGYVYDINKTDNPWPPFAYTGCIRIYTSDNGSIENITLKDVTGENVSGAILSIEGSKTNRAKNIVLRDCRFIRCARFMWDYGYLWQKVVFAHEYDESIVAEALKNVPKDHISSSLSLSEDGSICAEFMPKSLPEERDAVTFFGKNLPKEIKRGKQYFVLNSGAENSLFISETQEGEPIKITSIEPETYLFRNMFHIFHGLHMPIDTENETGIIKMSRKGAVNIVYAESISVSGCTISGEGDSTHISRSENIVFANNQIHGSRMGALFISFFCKNVTITGNTVYGTNGSRTLSVELGTEDITITGNTFTGGGRGSWFNFSKNAIISNNIFNCNTMKCVQDIHTGRICHVTGEFEKYPELYFTSTENSDEYGPIIIKGNIFITKDGATAAIAFNPGGRDILVEGNIFKGDVRDIHIAKGCNIPTFSNNIGMGEIIEHKFVNTANSR